MRKVIIRRRVKKPTLIRERVRSAPASEQQPAFKIIDNAKFEGFNPSILGLGDIGAPFTEIEAIAVVFDLACFTRFYNQVDPHLAVPVYLSRFLDWLFTSVKISLTEKTTATTKPCGRNCRFWPSSWGTAFYCSGIPTA